MNLYGNCCRESCPLLIELRHRSPSSPIYPFEVIRKPFDLSRGFLLFCGGESIVLMKKKAPSRSGFSASMYVVLKTRHVNPNIHVRRYQSHVRSPNLSATRPQLLSIRGATTQQGSLHKTIQLSSPSYIALPTYSYWSSQRPIQVRTTPPQSLDESAYIKLNINRMHLHQLQGSIRAAYRGENWCTFADRRIGIRLL